MLHITRLEACISLYRPNPVLCERLSGFNAVMQESERIEVETTTLDRFSEERGIDGFDFLLHGSYLDSPTKIARDELMPEHFASWVDWAKANNHGLDFNPTFFSHDLADDGFTLAHADAGIRQFWIDHAIATRHISAYFGAELGSPSINNVWIPDGYKDMPADRLAPRQRLLEALDEIFAEELDPAHNLDAVECKLFGLGSESYVVGSHEFYLGYAVSRQKLLCLDAGHFHPTETISDKLSAILLYVPELLLHVSRGVRWDSDHVVTLTDDLQAIMQEIVRSDALAGAYRLGFL